MAQVRLYTNVHGTAWSVLPNFSVAGKLLSSTLHAVDPHLFSIVSISLAFPLTLDTLTHLYTMTVPAPVSSLQGVTPPSLPHTPEGAPRYALYAIVIGLRQQ